LLLILALLAASLGGCAPTPAAVQGNVTLDGKPLDQAAIQFVSLAGDRPKTGAAIRQGKYELPAIDGLLPGEYRVEIIDLPPLNHSTVPRRPFPTRYAHDSPLKLLLELDGPRTFDFELKSTR
jgi:hypothetical protein